MEKVIFPNISESLNRALHEAITTFFDGDGGGKAISDTTIVFPDVDIVFDVRYLSSPRTKPLMGIFGTLVSNQINLKCNDSNEVRGFARQVRADILREIIVAVPNNIENDRQNKRQADKIWDMMYAIFSSQVKLFADRNIFNIVFPIVGSEEPNENYSIISGNMTCEVRAEYVTSV